MNERKRCIYHKQLHYITTGADLIIKYWDFENETVKLCVRIDTWQFTHRYIEMRLGIKEEQLSKLKTASQLLNPCPDVLLFSARSANSLPPIL